jgi:hypothetical protein
MTTIDDATAVRIALTHRGYTCLPLFHKEPPIFGRNNDRKGLAGWQHLANVTHAQILMWQQTWPGATNTGILTALSPALDADILNEEAAVAVETLVRDRFEERRGYVLTRIGQAPKRAVLFCAHEPFPKISVALTRPGFEGLGEKLEFLCDRQQLAVHGTHPSGVAYRWFGGTPWTVPRDELPLIDAKQAGKLISDIVDMLMKEHGYATARISSRGLSTPSEGGTDWNTLVANIVDGADLHESIRDLAAKLIRSGMHPGAAVHILRALMRVSSCPHHDRWRERYDDIPRAVFTATRLIDAEHQATAD